MKKLLPVCLLLLSMISCFDLVRQLPAATSPWTYSDLRAIDPSDSNSTYNDIVAFYSRQDSHLLQFRIDFLDLSIENNPSLVFLINNGWEGNTDLPFEITPEITWNYLLSIPSDGHVTLKDQQGRLVESPKFTIIRDLDLDAIVINIDGSSIKGLSPKTEIELLSVDNPSSEIDQVGPVKLSESPPIPGKVILAFDDTFKPDTPAQALRSWDGAHTGPFSSRHGLVSLVEAVEKTGIPVFLFDIKNPRAWSAFDYLGIASRVQALINQGKIIVVDSQETFSPVISQMTGEAADSFVNDLSGEIPSIPVRKALLAAAQNPKIPLVVGGDFRKTAWGNRTVALSMLSYIKYHPWLEPVGDRSLIEQKLNPRNTQANPLVAKIEADISQAPSNIIKTLAEQLLASLTSPANQVETDLKHAYLGQIGHLLAISRWSAGRQPISDCSQDIDWDGEPECVLASHDLVVVIDLKGGAISFAFNYHAGEFHQIIGPSYQLATGLSDPMSWKLDQGVAADPSVIPGAFSSMNNKWMNFQVARLEPSSITIRDEDKKLEKRFQLSSNGIQFQYRGFKDETFAIPLILDPWVMEQKNWADFYSNELLPNHWFSRIQNKVIIETIHEDPLEVSTFKDSYSYIKAPEDPSFEYPVGHYLPFPLALGLLKTDGEGVVTIKINH